MNEFRVQKIYQSPQKLNFIFTSINKSKLKLSKKIYNLQTRNIKKFIKQQRQIEQKNRKQISTLKRNPSNSKKKYDENQLLEMEYKINEGHREPIFMQKCKTQMSQQQSQYSLKKRNKGKIFTKNEDFLNFNNKSLSKIRQKQITQIQCPSFLKHQSHFSQFLPKITIRQKSQTFFESPSLMKNSKSFIHIRQSNQFSNNLSVLSNKLRTKKLQKMSSSLSKSQNNAALKPSLTSSIKPIQKFIEITDDKMIRYIKSLHILVDGFYQYGKPLNENRINEFILKRYQASGSNEKTQNSQIPKQKSTISDERNEREFRLPHMEFISEAETRKSIHRIINLSIKNIQKIVFRIFDFNHNGIIDQNDLIKMIQLTQKIPEVKSDLLKMVRYVCKQDNISISNANSMSYREQQSTNKIQNEKNSSNRYQTIATPKNSEDNLKIIKINKLNEKKNYSQTHDITQTSEIQSFRKSQKKSERNNTINFDKDKLFCFLQTQNNFRNIAKSKQKFKVGINIQVFYKIFQNQRPMIFYDILKLLFKIKNEDLIHPIKQLISQKSLKKCEKQIVDQNKSQGFKDYDVPDIIRDFQNKFECKIEISKYKNVLNVQKIKKK